jgi:hypothetical protein
MLNTQLLYNSPIKIWKLSKIVSDCLNVVNDGNHLWELQNSVYHSVVLESLNLETMHFWTYVDINHFYYLHMRKSFLKLCRIFFKHPVYPIQVYIYSILKISQFMAYVCNFLETFRTLQCSI